MDYFDEVRRVGSTYPIPPTKSHSPIGCIAVYHQLWYIAIMAKSKRDLTSRVFQAFRLREPRLRSYIRRFFWNDVIVDDICQETIVRALEAERRRKIETPDAFLFGVARNVVRKQLDWQSKSLIDFVEDFSPDDFEVDEPAIEELMDDWQRMLQFADSVSRLPKQCQRVFVLKKVYGSSHKEISAKLGISISTL